jgi:hypothetical protein
LRVQHQFVRNPEDEVILHFEPSLDALSLRSDVISSIQDTILPNGLIVCLHYLTRQLLETPVRLSVTLPSQAKKQTNVFEDFRTESASSRGHDLALTGFFVLCLFSSDSKTWSTDLLRGGGGTEIPRSSETTPPTRTTIGP